MREEKEAEEDEEGRGRSMRIGGMDSGKCWGRQKGKEMTATLLPLPLFVSWKRGEGTSKEQEGREEGTFRS